MKSKKTNKINELFKDQKTNDEKVRRSVYMDATLLAQIEKTAEITARSTNEVIVKILQDWFEED